jgi:hypothetical protein
MNLNEPFFNDSPQERIWGNLSNFGSSGFRSGLPGCLGFQVAADDADDNGDGLKGGVVRKSTQTRGNGVELRPDDTNNC